LYLRRSLQRDDSENINRATRALRDLAGDWADRSRLEGTAVCGYASKATRFLLLQWVQWPQVSSFSSRGSKESNSGACLASVASVGSSTTPTSRQEGAYSSRMDDGRGITTAVGQGRRRKRREQTERKRCPVREDYRRNDDLPNPRTWLCLDAPFSCRARSVGVDFG
jgi:hypothetical protein